MTTCSTCRYWLAKDPTWAHAICAKKQGEPANAYDPTKPFFRRSIRTGPTDTCELWEAKP